ncbi:MAG: hypothetical protein ACOYJ1_03925 [Peptococcales bacterium]|jgi:hypothetical protein
MFSIIDYTTKIQQILAQPLCLPGANQYLDLAQVTDFNKIPLKEKDNVLPEADPIAEATFLIIQTMQACYLALTKIGINELLKAYLRLITSENQEECTKVFSNYIFEIYLYSLKKDYPYTDLLWKYLSNCFHVISQYLLEEGYVEGCEIFLQDIASMGKLAAQKGLHTSSIQHFLHTLELRAKELNYNELAAVAKNHRFNLEIF